MCLCEPLGLDTQREGGRLCVCVRQWGQHELALRHGSVCVCMYVCCWQGCVRRRRKCAACCEVCQCKVCHSACIGWVVVGVCPRVQGCVEALPWVCTAACWLPNACAHAVCLPLPPLHTLLGCRSGCAACRSSCGQASFQECVLGHYLELGVKRQGGAEPAAVLAPAVESRRDTRLPQWL